MTHARLHIYKRIKPVTKMRFIFLKHSLTWHTSHSLQLSGPNHSLSHCLVMVLECSALVSSTLTRWAPSPIPGLTDIQSKHYFQLYCLEISRTSWLQGKLTPHPCPITSHWHEVSLRWGPLMPPCILHSILVLPLPIFPTVIDRQPFLWPLPFPQPKHSHPQAHGLSPSLLPLISPLLKYI